MQALIINGGSKSETARALHINSQALYHRLMRIEEQLGVDERRRALATLHVALVARRYVPVER